MSADRDLPTGTVTFLFTDVEGSTVVLGELGADGYAEHRRLLRGAFESHGGVEVDTQGDAFLVAFARASDALGAAAAGQKQLEGSGLRVRMGVHTGEPVRTSEGYVGLVVHKAARIAAAGHGGQILLSQATRDLTEAEAKDLGLHRLKDLDAPIRIYQLGHTEFPPLTSLFFSNLPRPATPFLGREREVEEVTELLHRTHARLVTLVGPGGTGKTRLAIEAASGAPDRFPDGITWIALAPLDDPALLLPTVAHSIGVSEAADASLPDILKNTLASKRALLLLDNVEHLLPEAASDVATLAGAGALVVLATSRERLQLQGEQVYSVPTLERSDAIELFRARAEALDATVDANGAVSEVCQQLDDLPLALELAAARMTVFTPEQLLERLGQRLDLLKGGRDADTRHQTLRATIEWSHELLDDDERRLFRRLSVFAGGCTFEAAEEVCEASVDTLQSLLDKSLLRRRHGEFGPRYFMLETIREYAAERLDDVGEADTVAQRHAEWACALAERLVGMPPKRKVGDPIGEFAVELDNARRAVAWAWKNDQRDLVVRFGPGCLRFWMNAGFYREAVSWLEQSIPLIAEADPPLALEALRAQGVIAFAVRGDSDVAEDRWTRAAELARQLEMEDELEWIEAGLASVAWERGDLELAMRLRQDGLARARVRGDRHHEAQYLHWVAEVLGELERFDEAERTFLEAEAVYIEAGDLIGTSNNVHSRADLALDREAFARAADLYRKTLEDDRASGVGASPSHKAYCLAGLASVLAEVGRDADAARVWGAVGAAETGLGFRIIPRERRRYERHLERLEKVEEWLEGKELTLDEAEDLVAPALAAAGL
jgi:predicted ATPase